jgi:preprotein translocase subunit SecB
MKISQLLLEHYFFTRIHVDAVQSVDKQGTPSLNSHVECACHKDDPRRWMVSLTIRQNEDQDKKPTHYKIDVEILGFFRVAEEVPADKVTPLVRANAPAVLYGSVREIVALLTAQGPHTAVRLPSVTFVDEAQVKPEITRRPVVPRTKPTTAK